MPMLPFCAAEASFLSVLVRRGLTFLQSVRNSGLWRRLCRRNSGFHAPLIDFPLPMALKLDLRTGDLDYERRIAA